jgi:hypothetical protein
MFSSMKTPPALPYGFLPQEAGKPEGGTLESARQSLRPVVTNVIKSWITFELNVRNL